MLSSMLTAGVTSAPIFDVGGQTVSLNDLAGIKPMPGIGSVGTFNWDNLGQNTLGIAGRGIVTAGIGSALNGSDFGDAFVGSVVGDFSALGANYIGATWGSGPNKNPYLQTLGHGLLGCAAATATGKDCASGAAGGVGESILGNIIDTHFDGLPIDPTTGGYSPTTRFLYTGGAILFADIVANASGLDAGTAGNAALNAATNNYLSHPENKQRKEAARKCAAGDPVACAERDAWNTYDQKKDDALRNACYSNGASAECSARYADFKLAMNSYNGQFENGAEFASDVDKGLYAYTDTAEKDQFKSLVNVPHYDQAAIAKAAGMIKLIGNLTLDLTPGIGDIKAIAEAETRFDYALALVGALGPVGDGAKALIKEAAALWKAGDTAKAADKLAEAEKTLHATAGGTGNWTKELNGNLEPKTTYRLDNGHTYATDANGRVTSVEGELSLTKMDRNGYQQCATGKCGEIGDEGGHLIASSLGGAGDKINIVPQDALLNRGDWRSMENEFRDALKDGKDVSIKIEVGYPAGGGVRPNEFVVTAYVDGEKQVKRFYQ